MNVQTATLQHGSNYLIKEREGKIMTKVIFKVGDFTTTYYHKAEEYAATTGLKIETIHELITPKQTLNIELAKKRREAIKNK